MTNRLRRIKFFLSSVSRASPHSATLRHNNETKIIASQALRFFSTKFHSSTSSYNPMEIKMPSVKVNDINMYYRVFKNEQEFKTIDPTNPTMLVLHGGFGILDHQIEVKPWMPFSKRLQLVFMDQRGCGRTDDGDQKYWTMDQFGDDIFNFCKALKIESPIVAGVSSGGYATMAYATRHPEHPRALILANTEPVVLPQEKRKAYAMLGTRSDRRDFAPFKDMEDKAIIEYAEKAAEAAYQYDMSPSLENFQAFAERGFSVISKSSYALTPPVRQNMQMKALFANGYRKFDYLSQMKKIKCPVLWFAGEWDPLHPKSCAEAGAKELSTVDLCILQAGAPIYQDAPDVFKQKVNTFLTKIFENKLAPPPIGSSGESYATSTLQTIRSRL
jgi:pimeloyl-ACP methyl ester carboxylesterase